MPHEIHRALVADDAVLVRWAVAEALRAEGFEVSTAASRTEALAQLIASPFAVIVTAPSLEREDVTDLVGRFSRNDPAAGLIVLGTDEEAAPLREAAGKRVLVVEKPFALESIRSWARAYGPPAEAPPRR